MTKFLANFFAALVSGCAVQIWTILVIVSVCTFSLPASATERARENAAGKQIWAVSMDNDLLKRGSVTPLPSTESTRPVM